MRSLKSPGLSCALYGSLEQLQDHRRLGIEIDRRGRQLGMDVRSGRDCGMHPSDLLLILVTQNAQEIIEWGEGKDWVGARLGMRQK